MNKAQRVLEELERMDELSKKAKVGLGAVGAAGLAAGAHHLMRKAGHEPGSGGGQGKEVAKGVAKRALNRQQQVGLVARRHGENPEYVKDALKRKADKISSSGGVSTGERGRALGKLARKHGMTPQAFSKFSGKS